MNPINTNSVQLIELHAIACDFVCLYLSESLDFLEVDICYFAVSFVIGTAVAA